jgi:REP element-mobilizing transposase RayT
MVVADVTAAATMKGVSTALSEEPIIAWHFIFCTYGFWLPNDPRGSWSRFVRSPEIYAVGGPATGSGKIRRSVAGLQHDRVLRNAAKAALKYPSVKFSGIQARAVARGIGAAVHENKYRVHACAIMPDHVHILMDIQPRKTEHVVGHLKARATQQINDEHIHPLEGHVTSAGRTPSVWARRYWCVFIHPSELLQAKRYIELNPKKAGFKPQPWNFIMPQK